jgi:hypothetical protein
VEQTAALRGVTWLFDRIDAVTGLIPGFPALLTSNMAGVVVCFLTGFFLFDLAISITT